MTADGAAIVAGYLTAAGTNLGAGTGYGGFVVRPGTFSTTLADYTNYSASTFFAASSGATAAAVAPALPADAGSLSISVTQALAALGSVSAGAAPGGLGATISISAPQIEIDPAADQAQSAGDIHLSAE